MEFVLVLLLLAAAAALVASPLVQTRSQHHRGDAGVSGLEAAREAKYREIRELELDFRMGKLSQDDYRGLDLALRAEAVEILRELDRSQRVWARREEEG